MKTDATSERRRNPKLRAIFDEACWLTTPFFERKNTQHYHQNVMLYARQALRQAYPDFSVEDINTLLEAVERYHRSTHRM